MRLFEIIYEWQMNLWNIDTKYDASVCKNIKNSDNNKSNNIDYVGGEGTIGECVVRFPTTRGRRKQLPCRGGLYILCDYAKQSEEILLLKHKYAFCVYGILN